MTPQPFLAAFDGRVPVRDRATRTLPYAENMAFPCDVEGAAWPLAGRAQMETAGCDCSSILGVAEAAE